MKKYALLLLPALLLIFVTTIAQAQTPSVSFQVIPPHPTTATLIRVHLVVQGCVLIDSFNYEQTGTTFDVRIETPDFCDPDSVIPEMYLDIGPLPAGEYVFRYFGCGFAPPGEIVCTPMGEETVVVAALAPTHTIPALSLFGGWALTALLAVGAVAALRR